MTERQQLEQAIAALEAQRATLGDATVDASIAALREKMADVGPAGPDALQLRGERRQATVILADVKGSTALAERVDTETWVGIMNRVFQILGTEIYRYGGEIDQYRGDGLVAFFGVPTAHEDDPERALLAALAMQESIAAYATELEESQGVELLLRIGMNTGEVIAATVGDRRQHAEDTAMGRAIALAARMESAAEPGTVLVTEATYHLVQPLFEWLPLGEITVKGVSAPVRIYRPLVHKGLRGKGRGIAGLSSPLVGRDEQIYALQDAIARLQAGQGGIVTVVGEAGIGKSRLVAEVRHSAIARRGQPSTARQAPSPTPAPLRWIEGRCLSYGGSIAYLLWLDVLQGLLGVTQDAPPASVRDALHEAVRTLCPDRMADVYPFLCRLMSLPLSSENELALRGLEGETLQLVTFRAIEILIECAALRRPLVVVCEDLHWADPTSLTLLEQLLALTGRTPLLLICVLRPERDHDCWRIRETAARLHHANHTDLWLGPLSSTESGELVSHLLHIEDLAPGIRQRILEHAEGNPFYVEEILRSLIDSGAIVYDEVSDPSTGLKTGRWQAVRDEGDIAIPDTLHGVLVARIDRLQKETRRVLQLASVIGRVFFHRVLAAIAREERALEVRLSALQQQQLIRERARLPELEYIFKHHLTQEAAYGSLLHSERRVYHRQVAEALEQLFPDRVEEQVGLLAYHWEQAGETERAIPCLRRAGEQAAAHYANAEALDYFTRALALMPGDDLAGRYSLLLAREGVYDHLGERKSQREDLTRLEQLVEALDDDRRRAEVALRQAAYAQRTNDYPTVAAASQAAIGLAQAVRDVHSEAIGWMRLGVALWRQADHEAGLTHVERALSMARNAGLRRVEARCLLVLGSICDEQSDYEGAKAYYERALSIYRQIGDRRGEGRLLNNLGIVATEQQDYAQVRACFERALRIACEIGDRLGESRLLNNLGAVAIYQGDYAGAEEYFERGMHICREIGRRAGESVALGNTGGMRAKLGDYGRAQDCIEQALDIARETGNRRNQSYWLSLLGLVSHRLGDSEAAQRYSHQALLIACEIEARAAQGFALTVLGHALVALGRPDEATDAYQQALALRREVGQSDQAMEALAGLARISLSQGDLSQAQAQVDQILKDAGSSALDSAEEPFLVHLTCYRILRANHDPRASEVLSYAYGLLQEQAGRIGDENLRRSFLANVAAHREIVEESELSQGSAER